MMLKTERHVRLITALMLSCYFSMPGPVVAGEPMPPIVASDTAAALQQSEADDRDMAIADRKCDTADNARIDLAKLRRACLRESFYKSPVYQRMTKKFAVRISQDKIADVPVEIFEPETGVSKENARRALVNLHGGGFTQGAGTISRLESIPIAAVGGFRVISVDYRLAPEYAYPSGTEDAVRVYKELLKRYRPADIAIYGCSAGGLLTAEVVAKLVEDHVPLPAAIGIFCEGAAYWTAGSSGLALKDVDALAVGNNPYFKGVSPADQRAFPIYAPEILAKFPPSLLVSGTADFALSSAVATHQLLTKQGAAASLHIFEAMPHAFFLDPLFSQSDDAYAVIAKFFDKSFKGQKAR